jgi:hypothetical protein
MPSAQRFHGFLDPKIRGGVRAGRLTNRRRVATSLIEILNDRKRQRDRGAVRLIVDKKMVAAEFCKSCRARINQIRQQRQAVVRSMRAQLRVAAPAEPGDAVGERHADIVHHEHVRRHAKAGETFPAARRAQAFYARDIDLADPILPLREPFVRQRTALQGTGDIDPGGDSARAIGSEAGQRLGDFGAGFTHAHEN